MHTCTSTTSFKAIDQSPLWKTFSLKCFNDLISFFKTSRGVLRKRCSKNMQQIYRRPPMPKCDFIKLLCNFIEITLWHGCSPVNLLHISRTPFMKLLMEGCFLSFNAEAAIRRCSSKKVFTLVFIRLESYSWRVCLVKLKTENSPNLLKINYFTDIFHRFWL